MTVHRGRVQAKREVSWTRKKKLAKKSSRGVSELEASPEEIKSREVELGCRVGLPLLLFPNGRATDIVFMTLFCIAVRTAWCGGLCAMPDGHYRNILLFWRRSTAALVFRVGACFEVSLFSLSPFSHSSPSLISLLASADVKQQKLTHKSGIHGRQ